MRDRQLRSFQLRNFKAVRDSGRIAFGGLTVFIGNNGSGKSSVVEGLETFRDIVLDGLDAAMRRWRGFEYIWNQAVKHELKNSIDGRPHLTKPIGFRVGLALQGKGVGLIQQATLGGGGNELFLLREQLVTEGAAERLRYRRDAYGSVVNLDDPDAPAGSLEDGASMLRPYVRHALENWQFLSLAPEAMGQPLPEERAAERIRLRRDGSNIAEYLDEIRRMDLNAFNGILESLQFVLPYAADLQPALTSELGRSFYLKLKEEKFEVPGWLLSTGSLRILALLACLRHPSPPSLLVVEEVENGLDPRTLNMLVEEIRAAITLGKTQVILTTHSPYLLDLLALEHIVVVERIDGAPVFTRPNTDELSKWAKSFSPGQLYTMGTLTKEAS